MIRPANVSDEPHPSLVFNERQMHVLRLVYRGYLNKEIAAELGVSANSIKCAMQWLFRKLGARSRAQVVKAISRAYGTYVDLGIHLNSESLNSGLRR